LKSSGETPIVVGNISGRRKIWRPRQEPDYRVLWFTEKLNFTLRSARFLKDFGKEVNMIYFTLIKQV
jgi:hypothetical protein